MADGRTSRVSRELFLTAVGPNFGALETWVTDRLTAILEEEEVAAGDRVFAAGEPPDHFYFVRQGRVELVQDGLPAEIVDGPRAVGLFDVLIERPHSHSAYARSPLELIRIGADAWVELLEDSFELARMSLRSLTGNVAALEERLWAGGGELTPPALPRLGEADAPLDIVDRVVALMHAPPLRGAGVQSLTDLATLSSEVTFAAGERLFGRGAPADRVLVVVDGHVEAARENPPVSWRGGAGQVVCGAASFVEQRQAWEARAATRTRALAFRLDDWFDVMEENFEMVRATLATLASEHERISSMLRAG